MLHEKEMIFPEITAIAIGALYAPRQSWDVDRKRLLITLVFASVIGVIISSLSLSL